MGTRKKKSGWFMPLLIGLIVGWNLAKPSPPPESTNAVNQTESLEPEEINKNVVKPAVVDQAQSLLKLVSLSDANLNEMERALYEARYAQKGVWDLSSAVNNCYDNYYNIVSYSPDNPLVGDAALSFSNMAQMRCDYYRAVLAIAHEKPANELERSVRELSAKTKHLRESIEAQAADGRRLLSLAMSSH